MLNMDQAFASRYMSYNDAYVPDITGYKEMSPAEQAKAILDRYQDKEYLGQRCGMFHFKTAYVVAAFKLAYGEIGHEDRRKITEAHDNAVLHYNKLGKIPRYCL